MDFDLTSEQTAARDATIRFASSELSDIDADSDVFPKEHWAKCAGFGLPGLLVPQDHGGSGHDCLTASTILEALGYACPDSGLAHAIVTQVVCGVQLAIFGSEAQKAAFLPRICSGEIILAQGITEPDAGSDTMAMRTSAVEQDDAFVLNGSKIFVTNAPIADVALVFAVSDKQKKGLGRLSCLIVENGTEGFQRSKPLEKMGLTTLQNGLLFFEDCRVPKDRMVGPKGQGSAIFMEAMEWERILLFSVHVGRMQKILETCVAYARSREQFGQPIGRFQSISNKIADMRMNLELGQLMVRKAAWAKDTRKRAVLESSLAKLFVSESYKAACLDAIQLHGGYGYMKETGLERELRDSLAGTIYSGTSEIQRNIIAKLSGVS
jgi:alkylation response protein AidB-like acyl-CoA dehydrogenase